MIDSLELFESLKIANLPEPQARAIAQAIGKAWDDNDARQAKALAHKADSAKLDSEVHLVETSLKHDISSLGIEIRAEMRAMADRLQSELKTQIATLRSEFKTDIAALRSELKTEIAESKTSMIRWMFAFWVGQTAVLLSAIKFLR
jgi:hypothetical protein